MTGAIRTSAHPMAWACGRAGLVSGPRMLKVVAMPSSRRGTAAWRIAGWKAAEKQNVMPASSATSATRAGGRSSRMPSASRTSAEPDCDDAERLPCLTTRAPGARGDDRRHGGDVDRHRAVTAGADDVEQAARHGDRVGGGQHRGRDAGDLLDRLALGAQRDDEAGELRRGRGAGEDLVHRPSRLLGRQVASGDQRGEDVGPGVGHGLRLVARRGRPERCQEVAGTDGRSRPITASASWIGSIGCGTAASARDHVASQASCGRPVSTTTGGHS